LGRIPLQTTVREGGDYGRPVIAHSPESPAGLAFAAMAQQVAARVSVVLLQAMDVIPLNIIG
jgi:ATP-binding protein involved in chromosome partitioning